MSNLNQCNFIGRLGQDPEIRYMPNGDAVANFSIAISEKFKDKQGQQQEKTEWVKMTAFRRQAEVIGEYVKKGSLIYVSGKMQTRKWQNQQGQDQYTTEIIVNQMGMLGGKSEGGQQGGRSQSGYNQQQSRPQQPAKYSPPTPEPDVDFDDDIPF